MNSVLMVYCGLIVGASVLGGLVPFALRPGHRWMQVALSFVAGVMLGVAILHFVPHALNEFKTSETDGGGIDVLGFWLLGGFLAMFLLERFFSFHRHEVDAPKDVAAEARPADEEQLKAELHAHGMSWTGAFVGMVVHSLLNGVTLGAAVRAGVHDGPGALAAGFGAFLVIFLHKPFDAMTVGTLLAAGGRSSRFRHVVNTSFALAVPAGALLFVMGVDQADNMPHAVIGAALGASAGMFLCISLSDLLPELQFHHHDRIKLTLALIAGLALAAAIGAVEGDGHGHDAPHGHGRAHTQEQAQEHEREPTPVQGRLVVAGGGGSLPVILKT